MARRLPRVPSVDEARRLLVAAKSPRDRAIISFGLYAGLRRAEIRALDIAHISLAEGRIYVHKGKGDKDRMIPLHPELAEVYREYLDGVLRDDGPVFPGRDGPRIGLRTIQDIVTRTAARAGLKRIHPHSLRHAFGAMTWAATRNLRAIQELMGHSSSKTTEIYTQIRPEHLRETVEAFSLAGDGPED